MNNNRPSLDQIFNGPTEPEKVNRPSLDQIFQGGGQDSVPTGAGRNIPNYSPWPEMIGGTIGSIAGTPAGTIGRTAGAGIGGALGNITQQLLEQGAVPPMNVGGVVTPGKIPTDMNPVDINEAMKAGAWQAGGELAGTGLGRVVGKIISPLSGTLREGAVKTADWFRKKGGELTAAQMTESWWPDFLQNIAKSGWLSAGKVADFAKNKQEGPLLNAIQETIEGIGRAKPRHIIGAETKAGIEGASRAIKNNARAMYSKVDAIWKEPIVDYTPIKKLAKEIIANRGVGETGTATAIARRILRSGQKPGKDIAIAQKILNSSQQKGKDIANARRMLKIIAQKMRNTVSFSKAHADRSSLLALSRGQKSLMSSKNMLDIQNMANAIDDAMTQAGEGLKAGGKKEAYNAYRTAAKFYKENVANVFDTKEIKQLASMTKPADIAKKMFLPDNPSYIMKLKKAVGSKELFESMKASWLDSVIADATDATTGDLKAKSIMTAIKRMGKSYDVMFSPAQKKELNHLLNVIKMINEKNLAGSGGSVFIQLKQAGAITGAGGVMGSGLGALSGGGEGAKRGGLVGATMGAGGALTIFIAPVIAGKLLTNPKATKYLTNVILSKGGKKYLDELSRIAMRYALSEKTGNPNSNQ